MTIPAVDTVLLAGGRARRFGGEKARAEWRGRTLAAHVLAARPAGPGRTVLVLRGRGDPEPVAADTVTWDDPDAPPGPLRGALAGLQACTADWAWVTACDLPGLKPAVLELLRDAARPGDDAVVPEWGGCPQPVCALYAVSAAAELAAATAAGIRSLNGALARMQVRRLSEDEVRAADPAGTSFVNVNRPADLALLDRPADRQENTT